MRRFLLSVLVLSFAMTACKKKATVSCDDEVPSFNKVVLPLIKTKCGECHNTSSSKGGFSLTNYDEITGNKGAIYDEIVEKKMPPSNSLTSGDINTICCWIDAGAPNN